MANETTTTSFTDTIYTTILADQIIRELRPAMFMRPYFRMGRAGDSKSFDFTLLATLAKSNIESPSEASSFTNRQITTSHARATGTVKGTMAAVTDFAKTVSNVDVLAEVSGILSRTAAEQWEADATANLANFSNTTTAASSQLTAEDVLAAIAALEQRDVTSSYVGGFHPKQLADVRADITGRTGEVWGKAGLPDLQGHYRDSWGTLFDVPLNASTTVSSSGGNYQGAVFGSNDALGYLEIWGPRTELWRDPRSLLTYVVLSLCYGSVEVDDSRGQTVLSSTS